MNKKGFSLIEVIVIIGIICTLLAIVSINFHSWVKKYNIERQVKEMGADFESLRLLAIHQKKQQEARISAGSCTFAVYSSEGDAVGTVVSTKALSYPVQTDGGNISFDARGFANTTLQHIWVSSPGEAVVDSLIISTAKINLGKRQNDGTFKYK